MKDKAKDYVENIFENENFEFFIVSSEGVKNTPYTKPVIQAKGDARRYVIDILFRFPNYDFEGNPVVYVPRGIEINYHGYNMSPTGETVEDYIKLLNEAIKFASKVVDYYKEKGVKVECWNFTKNS